MKRQLRRGVFRVQATVLPFRPKASFKTRTTPMQKRAADRYAWLNDDAAMKELNDWDIGYDNSHASEDRKEDKR